MRTAIEKQVMKARITQAIQGRWFRVPKADMRTREGKAFMSLWRGSQPIPVDLAVEMKRKHEARVDLKRKCLENERYMTDFRLRNKLAIDYLNNREGVKWVNSDHLRFLDGRGHYAKTEHDLSVIGMIRQWHRAYQERMAPVREARRLADEARDAQRKQDALIELRAEAPGWYVVTIEAMVSKLNGNDGRKTYSFKILAKSAYEAYDKAYDLCLNNNRDRSISFIYEVCDSVFTALIEYVGTWTDESELEYGPEL